MSAKKVMFINYLIWSPESPNFKFKYELFSRWYTGRMLHLSSSTGEQKAGNFLFTSYRYRANILARQAGYLLYCLKTAWKMRPLDYIVAYDPGICGFIGLLARLIAGGKLVVEVNTDHLYTPKDATVGLFRHVAEKIKLALMRLSLPRADAIKFINQPIAQNYRKVFGLNGGGPKQATFFSYIATQAFRESRSDGGYILLVGHPFDIKGVDVMLKAFRRISPDYPDLKLKIIGHCPDLGPYQELAQGNPNVIFNKGMVYKDIIAEFEGCRFYVSASRTEGIPRVVIEAMSCGKAVIGSRAGGIPEVIEDGTTGLLFESENDADLAAKMRILLDDPERCGQMGEAGLTRAQAHFSPDNYANTYHQFLKSLD
ncbi:glycosyltransferase family 4 protein [Fundidesulfovibrio terrae]|uniref:glycosyltransferase family 4 protein n=1 Tax=Fundidesulfovibrio terrae TaxID=2922866 RepID=UPI001FAEE1DE|nr:glycosyltransferase family 4 protein [Fundidesulfovibrio terrae]